MMRKYERVWPGVRGSRSVPLLGVPLTVGAPAVEVSVERLVAAFRTGLDHFGSVWRKVLAPAHYAGWQAVEEPFRIPMKLWVRTVYDFAAAYRHWNADRGALVEMMTPLYLGRLASFIHETRDMTTGEAEAVVERQAVLFEEDKPYLIERCGLAAKEAPCPTSIRPA